MYRTEYIVFKNQSQSTEENHLTAKRSLIKAVGDIDIQDLDFQKVRMWKLQLDRHRGANTTRGYLIKLRVVLAHMKRKGYDVLDVDDIPLPDRVQKKIDYLSPEEVTKLLDAVSGRRAGYSVHQELRNKAIISLLYSSGIRNEELCRLNRCDIPDHGKSFVVMGKRNKVRPAFIDERSEKFLAEYLAYRRDNEQALFISEHTGKRVSCATLQEIFKNARRRAKITKPVTPHTMRHSFATNLMQNDTDIRYIQRFLGHANLETTAMYTHVLDRDLERIHTQRHSIESRI